jgi:serine/threonine protein kinase
MLDSCKRRTGFGEEALDETAIYEFVSPANHDGKLGRQSRGGDVDLAHLTQGMAVLGTPYFMAPEQGAARYDNLGEWTDVYGLGSTLFYLLTGRTVFTGSTHEVLMKVQTEWPIPAKEVNPQLSDGLDAVIWKCLQKDPPRRYANCEQLAEELDRCLQGRTPLALMRRKLRQHQRETESSKCADLFKRAFPPRDRGPTRG